jgi:hypothetical protein
LNARAKSHKDIYLLTGEYYPVLTLNVYHMLMFINTFNPKVVRVRRLSRLDTVYLSLSKMCDTLEFLPFKNLSRWIHNGVSSSDNMFCFFKNLKVVHQIVVFSFSVKIAATHNFPLIFGPHFKTACRKYNI